MAEKAQPGPFKLLLEIFRSRFLENETEGTFDANVYQIVGAIGTLLLTTAEAQPLAPRGGHGGRGGKAGAKNEIQDFPVVRGDVGFKQAVLDRLLADALRTIQPDEPVRRGAEDQRCPRPP